MPNTMGDKELAKALGSIADMKLRKRIASHIYELTRLENKYSHKYYYYLKLVEGKDKEYQTLRKEFSDAIVANEEEKEKYLKKIKALGDAVKSLSDDIRR